MGSHSRGRPRNGVAMILASRAARRVHPFGNHQSQPRRCGDSTPGKSRDAVDRAREFPREFPARVVPPRVSRLASDHVGR